MQQIDVLVVGAGLAGLMAARIIEAAGHSVVVVDKGRSVGGRMATRRMGQGVIDHGAQFFTVRSETLHQLVEVWLAEGLVFEWARGWSRGSVDPEPADGYPRYAVRGGMNALAKHLARGITAHTDVTITSLATTAQGWQAQADNGTAYQARAAVLTPPVPQSLALLEAVSLSPADQQALERIVYAPCMAGLFWVDGKVNLPEPGALQRPGQPISWIADNQRKGISIGARLITVHTNPGYSRALWDLPDTDVLNALQAELMAFLAPTALIKEGQLKRWRYALPEILHDRRYLQAAELPPLFFAGDAFGEPRVEGAILSGRIAGEKLLPTL